MPPPPAMTKPSRLTSYPREADPGARVRYLAARECRIRDRIRHGDIGIGRRVSHEAPHLALDARLEIDLGPAADLAAQTLFGKFWNEFDARSPLPHRLRHRCRIATEAAHDAEP